MGAYIGGSASEGWEMNPTKWAWDGNTWKGIGLGAVAGGAAGVGFYYAAPALAGTGFFSSFGASGTIGAYTITGAAAGGAAGYGAGFGGGMLYSNGDWGYSHQSGIFGAKIGATIGSVAGAIAGKIASYVPPSQSSSKIEMPGKPEWEGSYFQGTEEESKEMLLKSSKLFNIETQYWSTNRGYYFSPAFGQAYGIEYDPINMSVINLNAEMGFQKNAINSSWRYTYVEKSGGDLYLSPNIFQRSRVYYKAHTHPKNSEPGSSDLANSFFLGIRSVVFGWSGIAYWYGGYGYWK